MCVRVCTCVTHSYLKKPAICGGNESEGVHERSFPEKPIFEGRFQEKNKQPNSTIGMFRLRLCSITLGHHGYSLQLHLSVLPDAQAVGPHQRLAVPQQKAAVSSKPGQQHLGHLTPNSPIINGLDQRALRLHAASVARARLQAYSRLQARPVLKKQENLFFFLLLTLPSRDWRLCTRRHVFDSRVKLWAHWHTLKKIQKHFLSDWRNPQDLKCFSSCKMG